MFSISSDVSKTASSCCRQSSAAIRCPSTSIRHRPWFLTGYKLVGVTSPLSSNILSSGSQLNGCVPVNRTSLSCRATQWSVLHLSHLVAWLPRRISSATRCSPPFSPKVSSVRRRPSSSPPSSSSSSFSTQSAKAFFYYRVSFSMMSTTTTTKRTLPVNLIFQPNDTVALLFDLFFERC